MNDKYIYALCELGSHDEFRIELIKINYQDKDLFAKYWNDVDKCIYYNNCDIILWINGDVEKAIHYDKGLTEVMTIQEHQNKVKKDLQRFYEMKEKHFMYKQPEKVKIWESLLNYSFADI